jgi:endonuclease III
MNNSILAANLARVEKSLGQRTPPAMVKIGQKADPFRVLVGCLISARTRDEVTESACARLFQRVKGPRDLLKLTSRQLEKAIYPVAFYRNKAKALKSLSSDLIERFGGEVPETLEELLTLQGVGRKTANLTLILAFDGMGICVDTHVHRIANRWGYVETDTPDQTEQALREKLPKKYWQRINELLVGFGQTVCKPISPLCSQCPVEKNCSRLGVEKHR